MYFSTDINNYKMCIDGYQSNCNFGTSMPVRLKGKAKYVYKDTISVEIRISLVLGLFR